MKLHKYIVSDGKWKEDFYSVRKQCQREVKKRYCISTGYLGDQKNLTFEYVGEVEK